MAGRPKTRARIKPPDAFAEQGGYGYVTTLPVEESVPIVAARAGIEAPEPVSLETIRSSHLVPYEDDKAEIILSSLAEGSTIRKACALAGITVRTSHGWMTRRPDFASRWHVARAEGAHTHADGIADVVEQVKAGYLDPQAGRTIIDALKWLASKFAPRVYGDRLELNATVQAAGPDLSNVPTECLLELEAVLAKYGLGLDMKPAAPDPSAIPGEFVSVIDGALTR